MAKDSALITHAHNNGVNGAILQAAAVFLALTNDDKMLKKLQSLASDFQGKAYTKALKVLFIFKYEVLSIITVIWFLFPCQILNMTILIWCYQQLFMNFLEQKT